MGNTNGTISYQSIYVNSGITASVISATTISANTFYGGSLSASFIGNKTVNDQEFKYISGITSNTQTQLNTKRFFNEPFIVSGTPSGLSTAKTLIGDGIILNDNGSTIELNAVIKNLVLNTITVSSGISAAELNFNPTGWNTSPLLSSSFIVITQENTASIISGLSGGTPGRICVLRNGSAKSLFVLEHDSDKTNVQNRFLFSDGEAYFLLPKQNITLIYNGLGVWTNLYTILKKNKYRNYTDFGNFKTGSIGEQFGAGNLAGKYTSGISDFGGFALSGKNTSYLDSTDTIVFNYSGTYPTIRPFRFDYPSDCGLIIGKIALNTDIGWNDNTRFVFGTGNVDTAKRGGFATATFTSFTPMAWITPPTGALDNTVWWIRLGSTIPIFTGPTSLKLSATTNNWVYLTNYCSGTQTPFVCQLYSFDFKTFTIVNSVLGASAYVGTIYNIWSQIQTVGTTNAAYLDELIFTSNVNY